MAHRWASLGLPSRVASAWRLCEQQVQPPEEGSQRLVERKPGLYELVQIRQSLLQTYTNSPLPLFATSLSKIVDERGTRDWVMYQAVP